MRDGLGCSGALKNWLRSTYWLAGLNSARLPRSPKLSAGAPCCTGLWWVALMLGLAGAGLPCCRGCRGAPITACTGAPTGAGVPGASDVKAA